MSRFVTFYVLRSFIYTSTCLVLCYNIFLCNFFLYMNVLKSILSGKGNDKDIHDDDVQMLEECDCEYME